MTLSKADQQLILDRARAANPPVPSPDQVIPTPAPTPVAKPKPKPKPAIAAPTPPTPSDLPSLLSTLRSLSPDPLSFDDCGTLMTALTDCYDRLGIARNQKRAQLEEGSHIAHCKTCQRKIDISKSGGFQVQTRRDEHFQPMNVYFCSQNCLLGENLRGAQRTKPGPHNQAGQPPSGA